MSRRIEQQYSIFIFLLILLLAKVSHGQNVLLIKNRSNSDITTIKEKDYVQLYYLLNQGEKIFVFGNVKDITQTSVTLKTGAEIKIDRIANIARIPLTKRLILPSILMGISISVLGTLTGAPPSLQILAIAPAILITITYVTKVNRRNLKKNQVGYTIDIDIVPE